MNVHALSSVLSYAWKAQTIYDIHPPMAFSFAGEVLEDRRHFDAHERIEARRQELLTDRSLLTIRDLGAGSKPQRGQQRRISDMVASSASPERFGRYLLSCADWLGAFRVLELGSNFGIGAAYLASGMKAGGKLITLEGDEQLAAIARQTLSLVHPVQDAEVRQGSFDALLEQALQDLGTLDLAFVDGHHEQQATIDYFRRMLPWIHDQSVLIIDDIHWSPGMEAAWRELQRHPRVKISIDLWRWGLLFFDPKVLYPQHLVLAPAKWKPWRMGFFSSR